MVLLLIAMIFTPAHLIIQNELLFLFTITITKRLHWIYYSSLYLLFMIILPIIYRPLYLWIIFTCSFYGSYFTPALFFITSPYHIIIIPIYNITISVFVLPFITLHHNTFLYYILSYYNCHLWLNSYFLFMFQPFIPLLPLTRNINNKWQMKFNIIFVIPIINMADFTPVIQLYYDTMAQSNCLLWLD